MGSRARIALYIPNLIGYGRLALTVVAARYLWVDVRWFLALQCACIVSDAFDGFAARKMNQCSKFGEILDVIADIHSRTLSWCAVLVLSKGRLGWLDTLMCAVVPTLEWTTAIANQVEAFNAQINWKTVRDDMPWLLARIFANGFKNPLGALAVFGLFFYPLARAAQLGLPMTSPYQEYLAYVVPVALAGRALCFWAEMWIISCFADKVLRMDVTPNQPTTQPADTKK